MKKLIVAGVLVLGTGCTATQIQTAETDVSKAARAAQAVVVAYQNNEATIDEVVGAVAKVAPQTGAAHAAAVDALNAAVLLQSNAATVDQVQAALGRVATSTAPTK